MVTYVVGLAGSEYSLTFQSRPCRSYSSDEVTGDSAPGAVAIFTVRSICRMPE